MAIWVDGWQWECCGETVHLGDTVTLPVRSEVDRAWLVDVLGADLAHSVTAVEDHHADDALDLRTGRVTGVRAVTCDFAQRPEGPGDTLFPVPGTTRVAKVSGLDRFECLRHAYQGYLVDLDAPEGGRAVPARVPRHAPGTAP